jgi:hypothetical protein
MICAGLFHSNLLLASGNGEDPQLYVLPLSEKTTRQENLGFLHQFLEAEEVYKVCYNTQDALKVVLEDYPKRTQSQTILFSFFPPSLIFSKLNSLSLSDTEKLS